MMSEKSRSAVGHPATENRPLVGRHGLGLERHLSWLVQCASLCAFLVLLAAGVLEGMGARFGVRWLMALSFFAATAVAGIEVILVGCEVSLLAVIGRYLLVRRHQLPHPRVRSLWSLFGKGLRLVWWSSSLMVAAMCLPWAALLPLQMAVMGGVYALLIAVFGLQWAAAGEYRRRVLEAFELESSSPVFTFPA